MNEVEFRVNGMTCAHCERALSAELGSVPGVTGAEIDASSGRVLLRFGGLVERAAVADAVSEAGFELVDWENEAN